MWVCACLSVCLRKRVCNGGGEGPSHLPVNLGAMDGAVKFKVCMY